MEKKRVVIIGGGIAGTTVAEQLPKEEFEITLIEREMHPLYSRVLLPHYLRGQILRERVFLKKEEWYQEKGIDWMRGVQVELVDEKNKFVQTSEGREIPYDILVIAGGGEVRLTDADLPEICYLRGIDDAETILAQTAKVKVEQKPPKAFVAGSSFIAFEFVNYFHVVAGFETHIAMRSHGFWPKFLHEDMQDHIMTHASNEGIHIYTEEPEFEIQGGQSVESVKLKSKTIEEVSIAGIGIGIIPELNILGGTDIELSNAGVHVNEFLETSTEDIYAIGDIAHYKDIHTGRMQTVGNWQNAIMQARYLVNRLKGEGGAFDLITSYATAILGLEITFIGDTLLDEADEVRIIGQDDAKTQLFERGGITVGAVIAGKASERTKITNAIKNGELYAA